MKKQRPLLLFSILMLITLFACGSPVSEYESWDELLKRQRRDLLETKEIIDQLAANLPERLKTFQKHFYILRSEFENCMLYFDLRSNNPFVLRDIKEVLVWFERETERLSLPLKQEKNAVDRLLESLSDLFRKLSREGHPIDKTSHSGQDEKVKQYLQEVVSLQTRLQTLSLDLTHALADVEPFIQSLTKDQAEINQESNQALETFLLKRAPGFFSHAAWSVGFDSARRWVSRFDLYLLEPIHLKQIGWWVFLGKILSLSLALMAMSAFFLRRMKKRFDRLFEHARFYPAFLCFSAGVGAFLVIGSTGLFPSSFFYTAVTVILVYGLISLSRNLHHLLFSDQILEPSRLAPLWAAVSVSALLEALHIPEETFIPVWSAGLLILFWYYKRTKAGGEGWAVTSRNIMVAAMPTLAIMALLGWGYLSVLLAMLLLLFRLNVRLARYISVGVARIGSVWHHNTSVSDLSTTPAVRGLGFPIVFLTLMLLSLAWIFLFVGGGSLFLEVIRYRIGWDNFTFSIYRILCIFSLLFAVRAGIALSRSALTKLPERHRDFDAGSVQSLDTIITYVLWSLFIIATLGLLGISFRNLAVIAGGLSVGLGFGLQNIVNNFIGGLILLFGRSLQPGDLIEIDNIKGHIRKVTIRNTLVQTFSGATIFVPNSLLISQKMINWSHGDRRYRQEIKIGVAYGSDVEKVTELLLSAAKQSAKVLDRPPPRVRFLDFGESTLIFSLRLWIKGWADRYADSEVRYHITRIFRENNIEISFPQLDLHIRSAEGPKDFHQENSQKT